jgi:hypothetical protein
MMKRMLAVLFALALAFAAGCGSSNPASPDAENKIPRVDGTYTGPITFRVDGASLDGVSMRIVVAQAGSTVTINGGFIYQGQTFPITAITGTISATGSMSDNGGGTGDGGACGFISGAGASITFAGNSATVVLGMSTTQCGRIDLSGTLRK